MIAFISQTFYLFILRDEFLDTKLFDKKKWNYFKAFESNPLGLDWFGGC